MIITSRRGPFIEVTEQTYTPSLEEMFWYYAGTHAGLDPNNPYALQRTSMKRVRYVAVEQPNPLEESK